MSTVGEEGRRLRRCLHKLTGGVGSGRIRDQKLKCVGDVAVTRLWPMLPPCHICYHADLSTAAKSMKGLLFFQCQDTDLVSIKVYCWPVAQLGITRVQDGCPMDQRIQWE